MRKAAEILVRLLERHSPQAQPYSSLFGGWEQIVGDSLAEHSRVYEVRNKNLFVDVDHPGWMQLLLLKKAAVLAKVRRQYPQLEIRDLKIRVREQGFQVNEPGSARPRGEPRPDEPASVEIEEALSEVQDTELKEKLRRLLLRSLERPHD